MPLYKLVRLVLVFVTTLAITSVISSTASSNMVQPSAILRMSTAIDVNTIKPSQCLGLTLVSITAGSGSFNGPTGAALLLGGAGSDSINAGNGADCVMGGGGNDTLKGQSGNDVLIGGPGIDTLVGGPGIDACYGGGELDIFDSSCETISP